MATRSALGLLCLLALTATANSAVETIYVQNGDNLEIGEAADDNYAVESCIVDMNNGSSIQLYPLEGEHNRRFNLRTFEKCRTSVYKMTANDEGNWKIKMSFKGKNPINHEYNVYVRKIYQKKTAFPSSSIKVYKDQSVAVHFNEKFENMNQCKIISPRNKEYNLTSNKSTNIKLYGGCGVKMYIKNKDDEAEYNGKWTLVADLKNNTAFYATFNILVKDINDLKPNDNTFIFKRGDTGTITFGEANRDDKSKMCILENPKGERMPITSGPCSHKIPIVSEYHEGIWTAYYGLEGTEKLVKQKINVKIYEDTYLNSSTSVSKNGDVHLLCQVRTRSMKFCTFERPDGQLVHMSNAVGNEKYEYYGNGISEEERYITSSRAVYDCGITIHKPNNDEYGSWKCLMGVSEKPDIVGKILKVTPPARSSLVIKPTPKSKDVYAKRGTQFKVKCSANEPLSYCWLRSPNGTVHSVVSEKYEPPALKYEGQGFDLGDCTAAIENASDADDGKWSCHMGVANGPELETNFKVHLKETHLMADKDLVVIEKNGQSDLICRPLPDSENIIDSCRWVNPAGHGINIDPKGRYITQTESTHCRLSFRVLNLEDDIGEWSCFARFTNLEEGSARMIVVYNQSSSLATFLSVALVISLLACVALGVLIFILYRRRLAHHNVDEKILDEKPAKYP